MTTKLKSTPVLKSRLLVEQKIHETVSAQIFRESLVAERDSLILEVQTKKNPAIDELTEEIEGNLALIEQWADFNRTEFGDAQSIVINEHRIGYRVGQPTVKPCGKLKFPMIIKAILAKGGELAKKFLRIKTELNKEAVLETARIAECAVTEVRDAAAAELAEIGCEVVQGESFYLEPNRAGQADTTLKKEAA